MQWLDPHQAMYCPCCHPKEDSTCTEVCSGINPLDLIYRQKQVKGFLLQSWIQYGGMLMMVPRMISTAKRVNAGLAKGGWSASQFKDVKLDTMQGDLVTLLEGKATGIKLCVQFDQ